MSERRATQPARVDRRVDVLAQYSWRLLVIAAAVLAALWLIRRLSPVMIPILIAVFIVRLLTPISDPLRRRFPNGLAAGATMLLFLGGLVLLGWLIVPPIADEASTLGETVSQAVDDIETWLVEDSPFDVSREAIDRVRERASSWFDSLVSSSGSQVVDGATLLAEIVAGLFLAVLFTFFVLKDGPRFATWALGRVPARHRDAAERAGKGGWFILGRYLRGAAFLGVVEAIAIGLGLWLAGGSLVGPVMIVTFLAAFVPILGAIFAGVIAVLVGLVTGGVGTAVIVAIVAIVVQQLDNDLLAPWIYGRAFTLHPMVILVSVVAGGALFGIAGTLLAVPVVAVSVHVARALRDPEDAADRVAET